MMLRRMSPAWLRVLGALMLLTLTASVSAADEALAEADRLLAAAQQNLGAHVNTLETLEQALALAKAVPPPALGNPVDPGGGRLGCRRGFGARVQSGLPGGANGGDGR